MLVTGGKDEGDGVTMGLPPHTPLGDFIPNPHLRFAAVECGFYAPAVRQVTLCSLTAFSLFRFALGTGLPWGCHPIPRLGISSPNPISASRRLNAAFMRQPSVR